MPSRLGLRRQVTQKNVGVPIKTNIRHDCECFMFELCLNGPVPCMLTVHRVQGTFRGVPPGFPRINAGILLLVCLTASLSVNMGVCLSVDTSLSVFWLKFVYCRYKSICLSTALTVGHLAIHIKTHAQNVWVSDTKHKHEYIKKSAWQDDARPRDGARNTLSHACTAYSHKIDMYTHMTWINRPRSTREMPWLACLQATWARQS